MSDYRMDICGEIGLSEYSNIYDYLCVVDKEDKFTISINKENKNNIDTISSILKDNKFTIDNQIINSEGTYFIMAHKAE